MLYFSCATLAIVNHQCTQGYSVPMQKKIWAGFHRPAGFEELYHSFLDNLHSLYFIIKILYSHLSAAPFSPLKKNPILFWLRVNISAWLLHLSASRTATDRFIFPVLGSSVFEKCLREVLQIWQKTLHKGSFGSVSLQPHWTVSRNKSRVFLPRSHSSDNIFYLKAETVLFSVFYIISARQNRKKASFCWKTHPFFLLFSIRAKHLCSVAVLEGTLNAERWKKGSGDSLSVCCDDKLPRLSLFSPWNN